MALNVAGAMSPLAKSMYGIAEDQDSEAKQNGVAEFADIFKDQLNKVNDLQLQSDELTRQMAAGNTDNVEEVLLKAEEARIALDLAIQITSRITQAYQEIMRMQV